MERPRPPAVGEARSVSFQLRRISMILTGQVWQEKFSEKRKLDVLAVLSTSVRIRYHNTDKEIWVPRENFNTAYVRAN